MFVVWRVNPRWRILEIGEKTPWVLQLVGHDRHVVLLGLGIDKFDAIDAGDVEKR